MANYRFAPALIATLASLSCCGCGGGGSSAGNTPAVDTLAVSANPGTLPVNSTHTFTATTNVPADQVFWVLVDGTQTNVGTPTNQIGGLTFDYVAPASPPLYEDFIQTPGTVTVRTLAGSQIINQTFTITAPAITAGVNSALNTVALGQTLILHAYTVGSTANGVTVQVNGIPGGSAAVGTVAPIGGIYSQYLYTAPVTMPMSGKTVTITAISQADPTKTASETITLM